MNEVIKSQTKVNVEIASLTERLLLMNYLSTEEVSQIEYTHYQGMDQFDATFTIYGNQSTIAEVKVRKKELKAFGKWMIEKDKYDYLMSRANEYEHVFYINFHADGTQIWDLKKIEEPQWGWETHRRDNTAFTSKDKQIGYLAWDETILTLSIDNKIIENSARAEREWCKRNKNIIITN